MCPRDPHGLISLKADRELFDTELRLTGTMLCEIRYFTKSFTHHDVLAEGEVLTQARIEQMYKNLLATFPETEFDKYDGFVLRLHPKALDAYNKSLEPRERVVIKEQ